MKLWDFEKTKVLERVFICAAALFLLPLAGPKAKGQEGHGDKGQAEISDGSRITIAKRGFSIVPPVGWEVYRNHPDLTLLMQVPYQKGIKYQRTIQVAAFSGPKFIDEITAKEFEEIISRKFSRASISVEEYRIRNHMSIELEDGREGLLFYSEFLLDSVPLMQAHILVSSQKRHFMLTFTDVAEHFEDEEANQFLAEAWNSMISTQLATRTPLRYETVYYVGAGVGVLALFGFLFWGLRRFGSSKKYEDFAAGKGLEHTTVMEDDEESLMEVATHAEAVSVASSSASSFVSLPAETSGVDGLTQFEDDDDEEAVG